MPRSDSPLVRRFLTLILFLLIEIRQWAAESDESIIKKNSVSPARKPHEKNNDSLSSAWYSQIEICKWTLQIKHFNQLFTTIKNNTMLYLLRWFPIDNPLFVILSVVIVTCTFWSVCWHPNITAICSPFDILNESN